MLTHKNIEHSGEKCEILEMALSFQMSWARNEGNTLHWQIIDLRNLFLISWVLWLDRGRYGGSETGLQDKPAAVPLSPVPNVLQNWYCSGNQPPQANQCLPALEVPGFVLLKEQKSRTYSWHSLESFFLSTSKSLFFTKLSSQGNISFSFTTFS